MLDRLLDLPAPARMALFGIVAVAVVALGYVSLQTGESAGDGATAPTDTTSTSAAPTVITQPSEATEPQDDIYVGDYADGVDLELSMPVSDSDLNVSASKAARFAQLYLSYSYTQDDADKRTEIQRLLAEASAVDLGRVFPTGATQEELAKAETKVAVQVEKIEAVLITPALLGFAITTTSTTQTASTPPSSIQNTFSATMSYDMARATWAVEEFTAQGADSPFQDENAG